MQAVKAMDVAGGVVIGRKPTREQIVMHALRLVNGERTGLLDLKREAEECRLPADVRCQVDSRLIDIDKQRAKLLAVAFPTILATIDANRHEIDEAVEAALAE